MLGALEKAPEKSGAFVVSGVGGQKPTDRAGQQLGSSWKECGNDGSVSVRVADGSDATEAVRIAGDRSTGRIQIPASNVLLKPCSYTSVSTEQKRAQFCLNAPSLRDHGYAIGREFRIDGHDRHGESLSRGDDEAVARIAVVLRQECRRRAQRGIKHHLGQSIPYGPILHPEMSRQGQAFVALADAGAQNPVAIVVLAGEGMPGTVLAFNRAHLNPPG